MRREDLEGVLDQLEEAGWDDGREVELEPLSGGIHAAYRLRFPRVSLFMKTNRIENAAMLADEADCLDGLRAVSAVILPRPLLHGTAGDSAFLLLPWIDMKPISIPAQEVLGRQLAELHLSYADQYGWHRNNHIGLTEQKNAWTDGWSKFYVNQRLEPQLLLAAEKFDEPWVDEGFELLLHVPALLEGHMPPPSLLHGDLWSGNVAERKDGSPVVFDPAAYYGDRETDIAMSLLFGGFAMEFYVAYEEAYPLPKGHKRRRPLYELYHVLNHANMFGGGYADKASGLIRKLLQQARTTS